MGTANVRPASDSSIVTVDPSELQKAPASDPSIITVDPSELQKAPAQTIAPWQPSFLDRIVAPIRDSVIGHAFGLDTRTEAARKEEPISFLNAGAALPPGYHGPLRAAADVVTELSTPANLGIMAVTGGLGAGESVFGKTAAKLVSLGFSSQMIVDAAKQIPAFGAAAANGDVGAATEILTKIGLQGGMAALGLKHGIAVETPAPHATETQIGDAQAPFQNPGAPLPAAPPVSRDARRASAAVPATGAPEGVARGQAAREDIAQQLTGKSWAEISPTDRNAVDALIAERNAGTGGREPGGAPSAVTVDPSELVRTAPASAVSVDPNELVKTPPAPPRTEADHLADAYKNSGQLPGGVVPTGEEVHAAAEQVTGEKVTSPSGATAPAQPVEDLVSSYKLSGMKPGGVNPTDEEIRAAAEQHLAGEEKESSDAKPNTSTQTSSLEDAENGARAGATEKPAAESPAASRANDRQADGEIGGAAADLTPGRPGGDGVGSDAGPAERANGVTGDKRDGAPVSVDRLPGYAQKAIQEDSMARRTNEGGSAEAPDPYSGVRWRKETVPIDSLRPGNETLFQPPASVTTINGRELSSGGFVPRGSMTKGPIVVNDRGEIIDGNNRTFEAIRRGDRTIDIYRAVKEDSGAGSAAPGEPAAAETAKSEAAAPPGGSEATLSALEQRALRKGIPAWMERAESAPGADDLSSPGTADLADPGFRDRLATAAGGEIAAGKLDAPDLERALARRYGEDDAKTHAPEIWSRAAEEAKRESGPEGPFTREFRHNEAGATQWLLSRGSGEAIGALHDPVLGDVDLTHGLSSETANPREGPQGLDHIRMDHPEALGHLQEILDTATSRKLEGNRYLIDNGKMGVVVSREKWGNDKRWVVTGYGLEDKAPASDTTIDAATGPEGRGGTALPPAGARSVPPPGEGPDSGAPDTSMASSGSEVNSPAERNAQADAEGAKPGAVIGGPMGGKDAQAPAHPKDPSALKQFLGEEKGTSNVGAMLKADIQEMAALKAKRDAAYAALEKAKADPREKAFGQRVVEYYTGERDLWSARVNQVMDRLRKLVPDHVDQEAIAIMRDFKTRPGELQQWLDGTHMNLGLLSGEDRDAAMENIERLRPAIERALNPTPAMLDANQTLTKIADASAREGVARGFLDKGIDPQRYFTHLLNPKGDGDVPTSLSDRMGAALGGKIGRRYAFAEHRSYPTVMDAIADNVKPKTLNAFDAFTIHGDKFATARATHLMIDQLQGTGMGKWGARGGKDIPDGWVEIAPHAQLFRNQVEYAGENGETQTGSQTLFVPPAVEKALRPLTDPDYLDRLPGFRWLRNFQAYTKAVQLGLSLFHATTENYMAMANMGPKGWFQALRADRADPEFQRMERDFIMHGGTTSIQGKTVEAYKSLQPGSIPSWGDIWRSAPGVREMDKAAQSLTDFTFGKLQRQFKVTDYSLHKAAWLADHPNASPAERQAAMSSISKEINAVYGGLNWQNLHWNHMSTEVARAVMLAPDWTISNIFNVKYAAERGTPASKLARMFWLRQLVGGMAATQAMSLMLGHKLSANPTQVYMGDDKDGKEIYQNMFFKGAGGDAINLVQNVSDYGAVQGLARSMAGKAAPVLRTGIQMFTNRDYLGHEVIPKGMSPVASTVRGAYEMGKGLAPMPLSVGNLKDMLIGPHADQYTVPEWLTTPFAGNPPRHVAPEGTRMTKFGLAPARAKKSNQSILDEIRTGKR